MKFKFSIDIDKPRDEVVELWTNPDNRKEYQDGYIRHELISGVEGQDGAVAKLYFKNNNRDMELIETIVSNQLPDSFDANYHHEHMDNTHKTSFIAINDHQTRYETEGEYTRINWIMPKLIAILFPSMYRKPAQKWMENFKAFAEKQ